MFLIGDIIGISNELTTDGISLKKFIDGEDIIEINNARVSNAKENLEVAEERFKSGIISSFDLTILSFIK